jgi:hypothetical protein
MRREVSPHHGPWRIDANRHPHHHLLLPVAGRLPIWTSIRWGR